MTVAPITVAVATRDRPERLARCLDALLSGSALPAELIVVDQGDGEATAAVLADRRPAGVDVLHLRREPRGLSASRNEALARSTTPFVAVTDDDCVPGADWVAGIVRVFSHSTGPDAVTGRVLPLGPEERGRFAVSSRSDPEPREFAGRQPPWRVGTGANLAVRRSWIERVGPYDERLGVGTGGRAGEDMDMLYRLLRLGARIRYEPDVVVYHERADAARRRASRGDYGAGIGAACALTARRRDPYAFPLLLHWLVLRGRLLAGAAVRARWRTALEELLVLGGTARGLVYGLRARAPEATR